MQAEDSFVRVKSRARPVAESRLQHQHGSRHGPRPASASPIFV